MKVFIVILAIGSISGVVTTQVVRGSDGSLLSNILGGCIYDACKDTKITGNVTDGIIAGCIYGACKNVEIKGQNASSSQPTPNPPPTTGILIVTKVVSCPNNPASCPQPSDFTIRISSASSIDPVPQSFPGNKDGTHVTLGPGAYDVDEPFREDFVASFTDDCDSRINAGEMKECTVTNTQKTP